MKFKYKDYLFRCDCGKEMELCAYEFIREVKRGGRKSCGCDRIYPRSQQTLSLLRSDVLAPGVEIGNLTCIGYNLDKYCWEFECKCDDKTRCFYMDTQVENGLVKSCGCLEDSPKIVPFTGSNRQLALGREVYRRMYSDGDLDFDTALNLIYSKCFYCDIDGYSSQGKHLILLSENEDILYNGIDRIDSNLPHLKSNCVAACKYCNYGKKDMALAEFMEYLTIVARHRIASSFDEYRALSTNVDASAVIKESANYQPHLSFCVSGLHNGRYSKDGITLEQFYQLSQMDCYYCGAASQQSNRVKYYPSAADKVNKTNQQYFRYNGLDKIDINLLHTYDNVITCCRPCNSTKYTRTIDDFYAWRDRITAKYG